MGQAGMKNNWKRNTRYVGVFAVLAAAFCMIVVLNINTGNVQISVPEILRILFLKKGTQVQMNIIWKIRLPRLCMAAILGTCPFRIFIADIFFQPDRRSLCTGDFFGGKDDGRSGDDHLFKILYLCIILCTDHCSIYRIHAFYRIYPASCKEDPEYGNPSGWWNHDRLYLFCGN